MAENFVIRGNFIYCKENRELVVCEDSYGVCVDGVSQGVFRELPGEYRGLPIVDHGSRLILPGLVDLHVHAPQYGFRGVGFDCELLEWLNTHTFPVESRFSDEAYAREAYGIFVEDLKNSATTRAVIFGTIHERSTLLLMELLEETGLVTCVGKVNMDRNSPDYYIEESAGASLQSTERFIQEAQKRFRRTKPIITPRFIPACTDELMKELADLKQQYGLSMQSHLSENQGEVEWVRALCPWAEGYGDAYDQSGILQGKQTSVMAHCVLCDDREIRLLKEREVFVAHCPKSNMNLMSGIAPVRKYMEAGLHVGLGSDVAGGENLSILEEMARAIQISKMYWRYVDQNDKPLTAADALYLATRGGGAFFGSVGSFEKGFAFDAVVMDDSALRSQIELCVEDRLERLIYHSGQCTVAAKYVEGRQIEGI
ncbi:MAG: amidohydrolase family protein [Clostridiales bacterium]|nr:amidohydrolase family protein [Clostridiales bacterium]